jgi:alkanesulfonate monooxygenase SsuD/methylene tetrahydromethanopterin reductase-like flavin-dependent oxidoreductase (luciferase family)
MSAQASATPRFGLLHLFESPSGRSERQFLEENIELIEYADAVGLDAAWFAEHHFSEYGVMPSTQVFGSFMAARTKRIRLGTGVVVLPFHNPVRLAEEFAFLDQLSEGRLDFGVGRGYQPAEFAGYGVPMAQSRQRYTEALAVIRQAWSEGEVNFHGEHYHFDGVKIRPRPLQLPHPPLFGSSFNPDTIQYQAMQGLNLLFTPLLAPPDRVANYRAILKKNGHDPTAFRVGGLVFVYVDEDRERALHDFEDPCMWYYRTFTRMIPAKQYPESEGYYRDLHGTMSAFLQAYDQKAMSFAQAVESGPFHHGFLIGDPAYVREKLRGLLEMYGGMTDVLCWTRMGGLDHKKVMRSMDLFVNRVIRPMREAGELAA